MHKELAMSMRFGNVTGLLFLLICVSAPAMAQERLRNSKLNATQTPARSVELGESWMDNADERELIQFLGLQPHEINPVQMMMRIDNDGPTDDDHGGGGGGGALLDPLVCGASYPVPPRYFRKIAGAHGVKWPM
jgi:hypothetical protein